MTRPALTINGHCESSGPRVRWTATPIDGAVTPLGNERIVVLNGEQVRLLDRDWNGVALALPARFETIASYPESILDPEGKNLFGLTGDSAHAIRLEPLSRTARLRAGWRARSAPRRERS